METQNKLENLKEKMRDLLTKASKVAIILIAIGIGYFIGSLQKESEVKKESKAPLNIKQVHELKTTSVAINERSELMIFNRETGDYEIFDDSVGKVVFNLYASQMISKANK